MLSISRFLLLVLTTTQFLSHARLLRVHDVSFVPDHILRVSYEEAAIACRYRRSALVNGSTPGPQIRLQEDRTSWIRVYNDLEADNLTMHWHGLGQAAAPFSDGTPQASQWPIPAGHFFDYEIRPDIGAAGTYSYHSHVQFQAISVAGPLIVDEASGNSPYDYAEERIIFVSELFNKTDDEIVSGLTTSLANFTCIGYSLTLYAFEDHENLTIIAADGSYTQPADAHGRIQINAGQRFDYLFKTKSEAELQALNKTNFWIQLESRFVPGKLTSYAILSYTDCALSNTSSVPSTAPASPPLNLTNDIWTWLEYSLEPLTPNAFPSAEQVSRTVVLRNAQISATSGLFWTANNHTWGETNEHLGATSTDDTSPNVGVPYLVGIYQNGQTAIPSFEQAAANNGYDPQLNVYVGEVGEVIDIVLYNQPNGQVGGFDNHPWHIHGGHAFDLGSGQGEYNATLNEQRFQGYNPVLRDTTMLYKYVQDDGVGTLPAYVDHGWRAWRLRIDNAGVWMVHCHTLQHMILGLQTVWIMGNASDITAKNEPFVQGYLEYGGSAYGNASYDPLVMHYFD